MIASSNCPKKTRQSCDCGEGIPWQVLLISSAIGWQRDISSPLSQSIRSSHHKLHCSNALFQRSSVLPSTCAICRLYLYTCIHVFMCGCTYVCMYVCMDGWTDGRTDRQMDGRMDGWMDGRMDGRMDACMDACMRVCGCVQRYTICHVLTLGSS